MSQRNSNQANTETHATPKNAGAPKKKPRETAKDEQQLASERGFRGQMTESPNEETLGPKMNQTGFGADALQRGPMGGWRDPHEVESGTPDQAPKKD